MGQPEIIKWLSMCRATGDDKYYSINKLSEISNANLRNTQRAVRKLVKDGTLEMDSEDFRKKFRIKEKIYKKYFKKHIKEEKRS